MSPLCANVKPAQDALGLYDVEIFFSVFLYAGTLSQTECRFQNRSRYLLFFTHRESDDLR